MIKSEDFLLLIIDLYLLRYEKSGSQWYELTDYLRDKLIQDGFNISYNNRNKDIIARGEFFFEGNNGLPVNIISVKSIINRLKQPKKE